METHRRLINKEAKEKKLREEAQCTDLTIEKKMGTRGWEEKVWEDWKEWMFACCDCKEQREGNALCREVGIGKMWGVRDAFPLCLLFSGWGGVAGNNNIKGEKKKSMSLKNRRKFLPLPLPLPFHSYFVFYTKKSKYLFLELKKI